MADPDAPDDGPSIVSSSVLLGGRAIDDSIRPKSIRHEVDEIFADGELQQRYNFIEYEFEKDGAFCRARAYIDSISEVAVFGPFVSKDELSPLTEDDFKNSVVDYMKRRFDLIVELGEYGYVTLWSRSG